MGKVNDLPAQPCGGAEAALRELTKNARELCDMLLRTGRAPDCFTLTGLAEAEIEVMRLERDAGWRSPVQDPPSVGVAPEGFCLQVLGVIDDDQLFTGAEPFVDVVAYWSAAKRWTVTHTTRADRDVADHEVRVVGWRPIPPLPPVWSRLWP